MGMEFLDLQVNGYGGVDFNSDTLSAEALHLSCQKLKSDGVKAILATLITEHIEVLERRLVLLNRLRDADPLAQEMIVGFHVEGPFISPEDGYRGAHYVDAVKPANVSDASRLVEAGGGLIKLVTLAPECDDGNSTTRWLADQGIRVAAGHSNATVDQLKSAIQAGLTMYTHLGNGCPMQAHRHDNIVQRVLSVSSDLWCCFIADGVHVPFFALKNYMKVVGLERCIVVTDAVAPAGLGPGNYTMGRWELVIGEDMVAMAPDGSHFVGAAITMEASAANLRTKLGLSDTEINQLVCLHPRQALGLT